jgi:hypothetical protein
MPKKPYCPWNGCGMPNGAAPSHPMICKHCGFGKESYSLQSHQWKLTNFNKICPQCKKCTSCGRIAKKHYKEES